MALVARKEDDGAFLAGLADASEPLLVDVDAGVDAMKYAVEQNRERADRSAVRRCLELFQHPERALVQHAPVFALSVRDVLDRSLELRAPNDLFAYAVGRLFGGARHAAPLALEPPEHRVNDPPDVRIVGRAVIRVQVLPEVERFACLQLDVSVVGEKLPHRPKRARPFARAEQKIEGLCTPSIGSFGPHEDLRDQEDRTDPVFPLEVEQGPDELVSLFQAAASGGTGCDIEDSRRSFQEQCSRASVFDGVFELCRRHRLAWVQRLEPPSAHRIQNPQPEIIGESNLWQAEALRQVIESEEIDEVEVPKDVDDGAPRREIPHGVDPRFVDLDGVEELVVNGLERDVRLVRFRERAVGHGPSN
jgi:hypothetical protein